MKRMLFIFNPNTGGGRLKSKLMQILCRFAEAEYEMTVCPTGAKGDARQFAKEKGSQYDIVVCCGGDGTLNEVVDGIMHCIPRPLLGYIPGGTTNDFASSLHLPRIDMLAACERIVTPKKIFKCDIGSFNEHFFNYVAAFGAFTDVSYATPQAFKNIFGYFAYIVEGIQRLPNLQSYHLTVKTDETTIQDEFLFGMVSNSTSIGGFSFNNRSDNVSMNDGLFEVVLMKKPSSLVDLGNLSAALLSPSINSSLLITKQAKEIEIIASEKIEWTRDGEYGGASKDAHIKVHNKAVEICI